jgi:putative membrane protein
VRVEQSGDAKLSRRTLGKLMTTLFAFLHHLAAFTLVAALAVEFVLIRQELTLATARRLIAVDGIFGASAGVLLVVGLLRVFYFEKGYLYYASSHAFWGKLGLFIVVGLISIVPTVEFLRWRKPVQAGKMPPVTEQKLGTLRRIIHWELAGIVLILLFAAMMARGGLV